MKFPISNFQSPIGTGRSAPERGLSQSAARESRGRFGTGTGVRRGEALRVETTRAPGQIGNERGFTMIEIAICLAIIGFALVAIIGVLPLGMNTQRDTREETVINQDATVLLEVIRGAARGADNLTNNVYAITNYITQYDALGKVVGLNPHIAGYTYTAASYDGTPNSLYLTNAMRIVGLLSTPEFTDGFGGNAISDTFNTTYVSNHVVAYVRSISGLAAEKPPQNNQIMQEDTFTYRVYCVNAPLPVDTNTFNPTLQSSFAAQLAANQRELRLTFLWPQLPNGNIGASRQTFRATIAGRLSWTNYYGDSLYFYQSQSFTNAP
jgi:prepilin-type N-terminal cleavage/methylation domain-containing protein